MQASLQLCSGAMASRLNKLPTRASSFRVACLRANSNLEGRRLGLLRLPNRRNVTVQANLDGFEAIGKHVSDSVPSVFDHIAAGLTTALFMADVDPTVAVDAAADAASKKGGFLSFFSDSFEAFLKLIDAGLDKAGVPYSYGFAIIVITILVKLATYPLSAKQVESTLSMQALQPRVKELQAKYANDPERLQVETAKMYQTAGVNPLAGCLPTLVTIPVFIGLYRALSNVADEGLLTDGFFWIPSLAGPTKLNGGLGWLSLQDGAPPLGWHDTIAYLVLPVLLIVSQYASQKIISPQQTSTDPAQQQTQNILKFLPLMIGYFSLNVPAGLTLYWFANNLATTAQQVWLRSQFTTPEMSDMPITGTYVAPKSAEPEDKRPSGKEINARRSANSKAIDVEAEVVGSGGSSPSTSSSSGGGSRGEKFRAIKAREAARKAAEQAGGNGNGAAAAGEAVASTAAAAVGAGSDAEEKSLNSDSEGNDGDAGFGNGGNSRGKKSGKSKGKKK